MTFAQDGDALTWLRTRTGRRGLVVWSDGRRDLVDNRVARARLGGA